jgi:branched-chain amino acid transport system ATP-binding protein
MLRIENIVVNFGGLRAIDGLGLAVTDGMVTGLIGPNGAGKTTTFNVITGLLKPDEGRVWLDDRDITRLGPRQRGRAGLGRTFQRLELFGSLSARENVLVALEARGVKGRTARQQAEEILGRLGLGQVAGSRADTLSTGLARLLEVGRALASAPKVLFLDEPSAGLDQAEGERLGRLLRELAGDGLAVLLVEHDMDLVMATCSQIYVLDFGRLIARGTPQEVSSNETVQAAYLGTAPIGAEQ